LLSGSDLLSIQNTEHLAGMQLLFPGLSRGLRWGGTIKQAIGCFNTVIQPERRRIILEIVMQRKNEVL
jgi:hypothetical protein